MEQYLEKLRSIQQSILSFIDDNDDSHNLFKLLSDYKSQSYYQQIVEFYSNLFYRYPTTIIEPPIFSTRLGKY